MIFSLLILGAPYSSQSVKTALRFANASIDTGNSIYRIFFYHDSVSTGSALLTPPQDEIHIPNEWQTIAENNDIDLVVCIASALKRGVLDSTEANRYEKPASNLAAPFNLSGLGQLVDASIKSDRVVTFGP